MKRLGRKAMATTLTVGCATGAGVLLLQLPQAAWACSNSAQYCSRNYSGLRLYENNDSTKSLLAEVRVSTTDGNYGVKNFQSDQGDRMEMHAVLVDRKSDGDGVYIQWGRWTNGNYCYVTWSTALTANVSGNQSVGGSFGLTANEQCTSGWHAEDAIRGTNIGTADGEVWKAWNWGIDPEATSMKMRVRPCRDEGLSPDTCLESGGSPSGRYGGISY